MVALATLDDAKARLRIDFVEDDATVEQMLSEATDIVIGYIKKPTHGWTTETVPDRIRSAILLTFGRLYEDREGAESVLNQTIKDLLWRDRDPALA